MLSCHNYKNHVFRTLIGEKLTRFIHIYGICACSSLPKRDSRVQVEETLLIISSVVSIQTSTLSQTQSRPLKQDKYI